MTMLDDARTALHRGHRKEAAQLLSRILQRDATHGEAWFLLAEAVDDFQQQTYCLGMAARLGFQQSAPSTSISPQYIASFAAAPTAPPAPQQPALWSVTASPPLTDQTKPNGFLPTDHPEHPWNRWVAMQMRRNEPQHSFTAGAVLLMLVLGVVIGVLAVYSGFFDSLKQVYTNWLYAGSLIK